MAENINRMRYMSHFRAIHRGSSFQQMRSSEPRQLRTDAWGFICPVHTPDGTPCGLLNHLTTNCKVTSMFYILTLTVPTFVTFSLFLYLCKVLLSLKIIVILLIIMVVYQWIIFYSIIYNLCELLHFYVSSPSLMSLCYPSLPYFQISEYIPPKASNKIPDVLISLGMLPLTTVVSSIPESAQIVMLDGRIIGYILDQIATSLVPKLRILKIAGEKVRY